MAPHFCPDGGFTLPNPYRREAQAATPRLTSTRTRARNQN